MDNIITSVQPTTASPTGSEQKQPRIIPRPLTLPPRDSLTLSQNAQPGSLDAQELIYEKAMDGLRGTMDKAREVYGLSEPGKLEDPTMAIASAAVTGYSHWRQSNAGGDESTARQAYAAETKATINAGLMEARAILESFGAWDTAAAESSAAIASAVDERLEVFTNII